MKSWIIKGLYFILIFFSVIYAVLGVETNSYRIMCTPDISTIKFGGFYQECTYTWKLNSTLVEDVAFCFNSPLNSASVLYFNSSNKWQDITSLFQYKDFNMYKGDCYYLQNIKWQAGETKTIRLQYYPSNFSTPKWDTYFGNITAQRVDLMLDPLFNTYNYEIGTNRSNSYLWQTWTGGTIVSTSTATEQSLSTNNTDINSSSALITSYAITNSGNYFLNSSIDTVSNNSAGYSCNTPTDSEWMLAKNLTIGRALDWYRNNILATCSPAYCDGFNFNEYVRAVYTDASTTTQSCSANGVGGTAYEYRCYTPLNRLKTVNYVEVWECDGGSNTQRAGSVYNDTYWFGYNTNVTSATLTSNNITLGLLVNTFNIKSSYTGDAAVNISFDGINWNYMNLSNTSQINLTDNISDNNKLRYKFYFISESSSTSGIQNVSVTYTLSESVSYKHGFWLVPECTGFKLNNITVTSAGNPTIAMICPDLTCAAPIQTASITGNTATFTPYSIARGTPVPILYNSTGSWTSRYQGAVGAKSFTDLNVSSWIYNQANNTEAHDLALIGYTCGTSGGTIIYNFSINFNGFSNIINISVYDEQTNYLINESVNVTLTDLTNPNIMTSTTTTGLASFSNLNLDQYEIKLTSVNYSTRTYYITLGNATSGQLNAYLLKNSVAQNFTICWYDSNGANVNGLHVWQYLLSNNSFIDVKDQLTTIQGVSYHDFFSTNYYLFSYNSSVYKVQSFILNPPKNSVLLSDGCNYDVVLPFNYVSQIVTPLNVTVTTSWDNATSRLILAYTSYVTATNYSFLVTQGNITNCVYSSSSSSNTFTCDLSGKYGWNNFVFSVDGMNIYGGSVEVPGTAHLFQYLNQADAGFIAFFIELIAIMIGMVVGGIWGSLVLGVVGLVLIMVIGLLSMLTAVMIVIAIIISLVIGLGLKRY